MQDPASAVQLANPFVLYSCRKWRDYFGQIRRCVGLCSAEQVWHRANERSNSIGNLVLHLRGNVQQWIVSGVGGVPFDRDRPAEFAQREALPVEPILRRLEETVEAAIRVVEGLSPEALAKSFSIQGYQVTGIEAVYHVVEHFAFHTGQIITMTKALLDVDLSLYDAQGRRIGETPGGKP